MGETDGTRDISCSPIGMARTPFETRGDAPRQGVEADAVGELVLDDAYAVGLAGIEPGEELLVVWYADEADRSVLEVERGGHRGVFASRSPDRPVPLGLTPCTVAEVDGARVTVRGVDMLDGTPILDLKPPLSGFPHG
ncbi:SAM-dependent methyltransferase [Halorussus caseinilyticus]|uniref:SAM-dependent methyltransferase n=1 Tax=Halorussus caseinilyticus TaxID=3034025 RepID=A0ABD5WNV7_9EURY|nr:SAM-dependent methyltransferase [Halorussus sp. DT72]